jgi:hypothetical protein
MHHYTISYFDNDFLSSSVNSTLPYLRPERHFAPLAQGKYSPVTILTFTTPSIL